MPVDCGLGKICRGEHRLAQEEEMATNDLAAAIDEAIVAAGTFIGLFSRWVLLPKKLLKK